jgi:hypothetical protein
MAGTGSGAADGQEIAQGWDGWKLRLLRLLKSPLDAFHRLSESNVSLAPVPTPARVQHKTGYALCLYHSQEAGERFQVGELCRDYLAGEPSLGDEAIREISVREQKRAAGAVLQRPAEVMTANDGLVFISRLPAARGSRVATAKNVRPSFREPGS